MAIVPLRRTDDVSLGTGLDTGIAARLAVRAGSHRGPTAGLAPGYVQGNLAILPERLAADFQRFCDLNPKPCPLIGMSPPGDPRVPELGADLDIRTDLPRYRVWQNGELVAEPDDITDYWRDDLVSFVIGCSFSFEEALMADGHRAAPHCLRQQRADVPYQRGNRARRGVPRADGGVDAADDASRRTARGRDHRPLSARAWRAGAGRSSRSDRHRRCDDSPTMATRCRSRPAKSRCSGPAA